VSGVLLIAGLGRSGSTLLGARLGQLEGLFFAGELRSAAQAFERGRFRVPSAKNRGSCR
jgi:hypothetical protein